jgi:Leucine-rich repeat (LRR) protein
MPHRDKRLDRFVAIVVGRESRSQQIANCLRILVQALTMSPVQATPVAGLTALVSLYLTNTQVSDLAPVAGLTSLETSTSATRR